MICLFVVVSVVELFCCDFRDVRMENIVVFDLVG